MKKKFTFKKFLLIYVGIWLVITIVLNVKLWDVFAGYQAEYDKAQEAANPDLIMPTILSKYTGQNVMELIADDFFQGVSPYENEQSKADYILAYIEDKNLSYQRSNDFTERKPTYDILADENVIGKVRLKQQQESDEYGFHKSELQECSIQLETPSLISVQIDIMNSDNLFINGKEVPKTEATEVKLSSMEQKACELSGINKQYVSYELEGFIVNPDIVVMRDGKESHLDLLTQGVYTNKIQEYEEIDKDLKEQILEAGKAYVMNMNQYAGFSEISKYIKTGSKAYKTVESVQSGLSWAGKPDELEIKEASIIDFVQYTEDMFVVSTKYKLHRLYRDVVYDEEMTYEWLYIKDGVNWKICDFSLAG